MLRKTIPLFKKQSLIGSTVVSFRSAHTNVEVKPSTPVKLFKVTNEAVTTDDLFTSGKVVVFGVPVSI